MKLLKRSLLSLTLFAAAIATKAQTADDIINKHIEAIGGKEKLSAITSVRYTNTNSVMGNEGPATIVVVNGKGYRSDIEAMGSKMVNVFTDKGGWMVNPFMGSTDPQAMPDEAYKQGQEQIYVEPFLNYAARGGKAESLGNEKVGTVNTYKIKLTDKNGIATTYFFDPATYYIVQTIKSGDMMGQKIEITTTYSDFKKTDYGWVIPQTVDINMGQFTVSSKVKNVEVNVPVDASVFDMKK